MRIAFFGTPDFAIPSLEMIAAGKHELVCVVCQPDRPSGRGCQVVFNAVKQFGLTHGFPVLQPLKISDELHLLDKFRPDIIVTCAYGQILRQNVLDYCKFGVVNVHASLLPLYRGSSPIQWAVINGERVSGVTIMQTDIGLDTGDIILSKEIEIEEHETSGDLFEKLSRLGAVALEEALEQIEMGVVVRTPQDHAKATTFPMLSKDMARIDFDNMTWQTVCNFVRGMNPWPVAWFEHNGDVIRVFVARRADDCMSADDVLSRFGRGDFCVACKDGFVCLEVIQMPGGKVLPAKDYINGRKIHL